MTTATTSTLTVRGRVLRVDVRPGDLAWPLLLPLLRRPALVLSGDDDPLIPLVNGHIMHRLIAGSELHVYRGGHLDLLAEPGRLAPVIEWFLRAGAPADRNPHGQAGPGQVRARR